MANGQNTKAATEFLGSLFSNVFAPVTDEVKAQAKTALIVDQVERVLTIVVIVGVVYWVSKRH